MSGFSILSFGGALLLPAQDHWGGNYCCETFRAGFILLHNNAMQYSRIPCNTIGYHAILCTTAICEIIAVKHFMLALHYYRGEWVGGLEGWGSCKLRMWLVRNRNTEIPKRAMGEAHANAKIENKAKLENLLRCLFRKLAHSLLCRDGAPGGRSPLADRRASQPFQYSWWTALFHFVPNMRTYWTDQNATLPLTWRLNALWGRDRFWKPAPPPPSLLPHWTSEAAVKMVSSN